MENRQILIKPSDLLKYMKPEDYGAFIKETKDRINANSDYTNISENNPFWIIGEW